MSGETEAPRERARDVVTVECTSCQTAHHLLVGMRLSWCCWCSSMSLAPVDEPREVAAPERKVAFEIDHEQAVKRLRAACRRRFFKPRDLRPARLAERLRKAWVPSWLVDCRLRGSWRAELGYDYEVVSHVEHYKSGRWRSEEVRETRVDWEPRLGTMDQCFENEAVPAWRLRHRLGDLLQGLTGEEGVPVDGSELDEAPVLLPDLTPSEVWQDARQGVLARLRERLIEACGAQHLQWLAVDDSPAERNWTLQLHPLWTTWYLAEDGRVVGLFLDGRSGRLIGDVLSAPRRARRWALGFALAAAGCFGLGATVDEMFIALGFVLAGLAGAVAIASLDEPE
ncbi:MAG: hypothetical protein AAF533_03420 [Acidobacteriota bacterium]